MKISQEPDDTIRVLADFCHLFSSQFTANRIGNSKWNMRKVLAERNHRTMIFSEYGFNLFYKLLGLADVTHVTISRDHIAVHFNPNSNAGILVRKKQIVAILQSTSGIEEQELAEHGDLSRSDSQV